MTATTEQVLPTPAPCPPWCQAQEHDIAHRTGWPNAGPLDAGRICTLPVGAVLDCEKDHIEVTVDRHEYYVNGTAEYQCWAPEVSMGGQRLKPAVARALAQLLIIAADTAEGGRR